MLIPITNDLYDIAARLQSVDSDYRLFFNPKRARFEVHSAARHTMQLALPFDELDARTVDYVLQTRVANARALFDEIAAHNASVERRAQIAAAKAVAKEMK